jgi:glutathione S-transferase
MAATSVQSTLTSFGVHGIELRYFPVIGRAQSLRHALLDAGIAFEDVRIPMKEWPAKRDDPTFAGPYRGLPTLRWGDATVAETFAIAGFVARRLGQYNGLSDKRIAELEGIVSNAYLEGIRCVAELIWTDSVNSGIELAVSVPRHLARSLQKLSSMDATAIESEWFAGASPGVADFFVAEAFEAMRHLLGPSRHEKLQSRLPRLAALAQRVRDRPRLAEAWANRPARFTARADEPDSIERLRALDLSAVGF